MCGIDSYQSSCLLRWIWPFWFLDLSPYSSLDIEQLYCILGTPSCFILARSWHCHWLFSCCAKKVKNASSMLVENLLASLLSHGPALPLLGEVPLVRLRSLVYLRPLFGTVWLGPRSWANPGASKGDFRTWPSQCSSWMPEVWAYLPMQALLALAMLPWTLAGYSTPLYLCFKLS